MIPTAGSTSRFARGTASMKTKTEKLKALKAQKPSLVRNINIQKLEGDSRPKAKSTVSKKSFSEMRKGWK